MIMIVRAISSRVVAVNQVWKLGNSRRPALGVTCRHGRSSSSSSSPIHVAIVGAGITGISTAYHLLNKSSCSSDCDINYRITLIDALSQPMAYTSAQSGENYRNWWPHATMKAFANRSIDLMENFAKQQNNRIRLTRRGYLLATRQVDTAEAVFEQIQSLNDSEDIRIHHAESDTSSSSASSYQPSIQADWTKIPHTGGASGGVDILHKNPDSIRRFFPSLDTNIQSVIHLRRAGDVSGQQLGSLMLETMKNIVIQQQQQQPKNDSLNLRYGTTVQHMERTSWGGVALTVSASCSSTSTSSPVVTAGEDRILADKLVLAAGPMTSPLAAMLGVPDLPISNIFHQKLAFEDVRRVVPRDLPFAIDLDEQYIDWTDEEREALLVDGDDKDGGGLGWTTRLMPGSIHCRPDGGNRGEWVKLGWALNNKPSDTVDWEATPHLNAFFPEIVLRGAARLHPSLREYYGALPRNRHHYGGWYSMTNENWPIIGPLIQNPMATKADDEDISASSRIIPNVYLNCAASGFGTMTACAAGELCAAWVTKDIDPGHVKMPQYADHLSLSRYQDSHLMQLLQDAPKGVL